MRNSALADEDERNPLAAIENASVESVRKDSQQ